MLFAFQFFFLSSNLLSLCNLEMLTLKKEGMEELNYFKYSKGLTEIMCFGPYSL